MQYMDLRNRGDFFFPQHLESGSYEWLQTPAFLVREHRLFHMIFEKTIFALILWGVKTVHKVSSGWKEKIPFFLWWYHDYKKGRQVCEVTAMLSEQTIIITHILSIFTWHQPKGILGSFQAICIKRHQMASLPLL